MLWTQSLPVLCVLLYGVSASSLRYSKDHCQDHKAQTSLDLDELMGLWYGIEVYYHRARTSTMEARHEDAMCPQIQLALESRSEISLVWQESSRYLDYKFRIQKPGLWVSLPSSSYPQFEGRVRVLKAVSSHMVLTFCSHSNHYSVLMSREKFLDYTDIEGVEGMIERFNLTVYDKSRQCRNNAAIYSNSLYSVIIVIMVCLYRS